MARTPLDRIKEQYEDLRTEEEKEAFKRWVFDKSFDKEQEAEQLASVSKASEYRDSAREYRKNWGKVAGLVTGEYWEIDNMTGGFVEGELIVLSAKTSDGKTMWALNMTASLLKRGNKVLFVTLENLKEETLTRLWNIMGEDDYEAILDIDLLRFQTADKVDMKMMKYLVKNAKEWGAEIIFIDHLHYLSRVLDNQAVGIGLITQELKALAIEYKIPIVLICQLRKLPDGRNEPIIDDLYGSVFISQDADIVMLMHRKRELDVSTNRENDYAIVKLWKNRNRGIWRVYSTAVYLKQGFHLLSNEYNSIQDTENRH